MKKNKNILSVENLSFSYNQREVLNNISFEVKEGDFISILGPNGVGKSTLVNLISKVLSGYEGRIKIRGKDIRELSSRDIAKIVGVVPQYTNPGFSFTVAEIVMMGRYTYTKRFEVAKKEDYKAVDEAMEKAKILPFGKRKFAELSGGEKQRVVIAQVLAQNSPILLLDEPTSHLDINFQIEFINLFLDLNQKERKTIVGVFHDINLALQSGGKIMLLKDGGIFGFGSGEEIVNRVNIKSVFGSDVFVGRNPVTGKLYVSPIFSPEVDWSIISKPGSKNLKIHVIGGGGAASQILNLLYNSGYKVSCGVVNTLDTDLNTAQVLEIPYVTEAPFSPISPDSQNRNLEFIRLSDVVILPSVEFGPGNFLNLVTVKEAAGMGKKIIVVDYRNINERDHTGGKAEKLYKEIVGQGAVVVESVNQILKYL